eukprot:scaffold51041_cov36-Tisochrysis_lutea.AAC.7
MRDYGNSSQLYQAGPEHALFAFSVLDAFLNNDDHDEVPGFENVNTALFVTWNMNHRLRGCIGTLEPRMLHKALKDYALTSAVSACSSTCWYRQHQGTPSRLTLMSSLIKIAALLHMQCGTPGSLLSA